MLDKSIQINCADCKSKKCLSFNSLELACPDYIDSFPASSIKDVCLTGALKFNKDYIFIDKGRCINCGMCAYRCPKKRIPMTSIKPKIDDSNISELFRNIAKQKKNDPNFPNLLVRNFLITLGYKAAILKKGVISIRTDLVGTDFIAEIEFGEDILETPRSILDDVAVLSSRYNVDFKKIQTLIFIDKLPHVRSEIWEVIKDIRKITNIKIQTISLFYLFLRVWSGHKLLTDTGNIDFYIDNESTDYRRRIFKKYMPSAEIEKLSEREELDIMSQSS